MIQIIQNRSQLQFDGQRLWILNKRTKQLPPARQQNLVATYEVLKSILTVFFSEAHRKYYNFCNKKIFGEHKHSLKLH